MLFHFVDWDSMVEGNAYPHLWAFVFIFLFNLLFLFPFNFHQNTPGEAWNFQTRAVWLSTLLVLHASLLFNSMRHALMHASLASLLTLWRMPLMNMNTHMWRSLESSFALWHMPLTNVKPFNSNEACRNASCTVCITACAMTHAFDHRHI